MQEFFYFLPCIANSNDLEQTSLKEIIRNQKDKGHYGVGALRLVKRNEVTAL